MRDYPPPRCEGYNVCFMLPRALSTLRGKENMYLLRELNWLSISDRINMRLGTLVYKLRAGFPPSYLTVPVSTLPGRGRLRSSTAGLLSVSLARHSTFGGRTFQHTSSVLWNSLPAHVTDAVSVSCFKRNFKQFLTEVA